MSARKRLRLLHKLSRAQAQRVNTILGQHGAKPVAAHSRVMQLLRLAQPLSDDHMSMMRELERALEGGNMEGR